MKPMEGKHKLMLARLRVPPPEVHMSLAGLSTGQILAASPAPLYLR